MSSYRMKYKIGATQYHIPVQEDISAIPLGTILPYSANSLNPPAGFLFCDGSAVSRTMYPDLFALIGTTFGSGDGVSTFNLPDLTLGEFLEGSSVAGTSKSAGLPNITGYGRFKAGSDGVQLLGECGGAIYRNDAITNTTATVNSTTKLCVDLKIDASRSSAVYGNSTTVQPKSVTVRYIIKAFNATTSSSELIDITQYASELNQRYDIRSDMTIIYPNNGTAQNPANVMIGTRYVMSNPFPGYAVRCQAEIFFENQWGVAQFEAYYNPSKVASGEYCYQHNDGDIVMVTGSAFLVDTFAENQVSVRPNTWPPGTKQTPTTAPCRIKVWKIGKIS